MVALNLDADLAIPVVDNTRRPRPETVTDRHVLSQLEWFGNRMGLGLTRRDAAESERTGQSLQGEAGVLSFDEPPTSPRALAKAAMTMATVDLWHARLAIKTLRRDEREAIFSHPLSAPTVTRTSK